MTQVMTEGGRKDITHLSSHSRQQVEGPACASVKTKMVDSREEQTPSSEHTVYDEKRKLDSRYAE